MYQYWKKRSQDEIKHAVFEALNKNVNYTKKNIIGIPASYLDQNVFSQDSSFLKDAPFLSTLIQNPNHIGCHTLGKSEPFFQGTQYLEIDLINICAHDILNGDEKEEFDGYVASGGTEANIQAIWTYRNYFQLEKGFKNDEICILTSKDNHYSMDKAANLLNISIQKVAVENETRLINEESVRSAVIAQKKKGIKGFIVVANMMTTMFGSIDEPEFYTSVIEQEGLDYFIHVDAAFGGFYFPFSQNEHHLDFRNPKITSITLDAHKMLQAPYGTGTFIIRKDKIHYTNTKEASYVEGQDFTLIGSRSGANAVGVWMILTTYGPYAWMEKIFILQKRTAWMCERLNELQVAYYRHPASNIITIKEQFISKKIAHKYGLVPDNHLSPQWYKIVIMDHVTIEKLNELIKELKH